MADGFELFGEVSSVPVRYDLSKFDGLIKEIHECIQQMIGKHLGVLRKELLAEESLREFSDRVSNVYRLLCVHEYDTLEKEANETADQLWEKMLSAPGFAHIVCCKESFLISQVSGCFASLVLQLDEPLKVIPDVLNGNIQRVDRAHIMGAPVLITTTLHQQFELIRQKNQNRMKDASQCSHSHSIVPETFEYDVSRSIIIQFPIKKFSNLKETKPMTISSFKENFYDSQLPVIIQHSNEHWKAFSRWRNMSMWCEEYGHRLIPIEIGKLDPAAQFSSQSLPVWKESTFTIKEYIHEFIEHNLSKCKGTDAPGSLENEKIGYLAQHHLFDQFINLQEDFDIPPYCKVSQTGEDMSHVKMNAWFGTQDTVTSLHFDSYDNFLTQIFGYKYVRLYSPQQSELLYPIEGSGKESSDVAKQNNISPVDVACPNLEKYPNFKDAPYFECILGPHDMLFIPHKWWHYVRSLSPSFSVNFWF